MLSEQLGAQRSSGDVEEIFLELFGIGLIVNSGFIQSFSGNSDRLFPASDDRVRVDLEFDESFSFSKELRSKDGDRSGSIADFIILDLGELAKNLGGGVVDSAGSENSGTVIGNLDARQGISL